MAHDLLFQDETLHAAFFGNLTAVPEPPSRVVSIFVSSTKSDLEHERRQLQEVVVPQLQRDCSALGVDVQLVDIQCGGEEDAILVPGAIAQHLEAIEDCHRTSLGCFFLALIGSKYRPFALPGSIDALEYRHIHNASNEAGLDVGLLDNRYRLDTNLLPPRYVLDGDSTSNRLELNHKIHRECEETWLEEEEKLVRIIQYGSRIAVQEGLIEVDDKSQAYLLSGVHTHLRHALKLCKGDSRQILCVVRQLDGVDTTDNSTSLYFDSLTTDGASTDDESNAGLQSLIEDVILSVERQNVAYFSVPWQKSGINPDIPEHANYLKSFSELLTTRLKTMVTTAAQSWISNWDLFPPIYRKPVQEVLRESQSHLLNSRRHLRELGVSQVLDSDYGPLLHIQQLMIGGDDRIRHTPIIVCGKDGCGKSTLLSQVIMYCTEWLGGDVVRIVRHVGQSPCATYASELLRSLCLHISLALDLELGPKLGSCELGTLSVWFVDLLKMVESTPTDLVIVLDDLHALRSPPSNQAAILGWLPWNLPPNVHVICSISEDADAMMNLFRSRTTTDNLVKIPPLSPGSALSMLQSNLRDRQHTLSPAQLGIIKVRLESGTAPCPLYIKLLARMAERWSSSMEVVEMTVPSTLEEVVDFMLSGLKEKYGYRTMRKVATFLACTTYGLRENELVELLASTVESADDNHTKSHACKPAAWFAAVKEMRPLLKEYYVDRRPYLQWSHKSVADYIRNRYLKSSRDLQTCYAELASAFHLGFLMEKEKEDHSKRKDDWCDILREVDELWYHLLQSGDGEKLKHDAICNFDFLQCSIGASSISYIRSILELVKCHALDWEVELLSAVTKQAVIILSQDPTQLATELLNWLKPFSDSTNAISLRSLTSSALRQCNRCTQPRLVPVNNWLTLSLPPQVSVLNLPRPVLCMVTTPDSQHVVCATDLKDIDVFHLPSKSLVRTFKGHKAAVTCLHVTSSGQWLISGSEDTDVLVWKMDNGQIKHRMSNHISGVLCVTSTHSEELVLSGSEIGVVIVASLDTGQVVQRLEKHRGLISCIAVNSGDDIFATGSSDKTVYVWCLEDYSLLNTICLPSAICHMDISRDSTFLVLACDDQSLHVRSLTTGSEVHCLQGTSASVTALAFGHDNCRCVVGCGDGKCRVFDIHSASLIHTLSGHAEAITSVQVQSNDSFLVTSGGAKVVVWNFTSPKKDLTNHVKPKMKRMDSHREPVVCIAVSKDGTLAVSGSKDNQLKVWNLSTGEVSESLCGHLGSVTCVAFAPNGLFVVSGSEDTTLKVWGLTLGLIEATFKEHQSKVLSVSVMSDSRRVLSVDSQGCHRLWMADTGSQLYACNKPTLSVTLSGSMVFAVTGKNDNSLKFWPVMDVESERCVSHSDSILCYTVTHDCETVITGSNDMSLKVWEVATGKLTQVLAGHEGSVTCVAVASLSPSLVVSGSSDCTLILWDMLTGSDNLTFRGHTDTVKCVCLTPDGTIVLSGAADNTIQLWSIQAGERISMLDLHAQMVSVAVSFNLNQVVVQLANSSSIPVLRLHNNPAKGITLDMLPGFRLQEDLKPLGPLGALPKRTLLRGNLKREQSFDSLYWDLKSSSPKHDFLSNLDELRRQQSLPFASSVWDGTKVRFARPSDPLGMQPKPKLAKHKMLKKQQSMFAFFPDHNQQTREFAESKKADLLARLQTANRQLQADQPILTKNATENVDVERRKSEGSDVCDSTVCAIA